MRDRTDVLARPGCRIERIVSVGQITPAECFYVQVHDEWVLLLAGAAPIAMGGSEIALHLGDHLFIPAAELGIALADPDRSTVWLAVHIGETPAKI